MLLFIWQCSDLESESNWEVRQNIIESKDYCGGYYIEENNNNSGEQSRVPNLRGGGILGHRQGVGRMEYTTLRVVMGFTNRQKCSLFW